MIIVSFKPEYLRIIMPFCSASESNKRNLRDRTLDFSFHFIFTHLGRVALQRQLIFKEPSKIYLSSFVLNT